MGYGYLTPLSHTCMSWRRKQEYSDQPLPQVVDKFNHIKLLQVHLIFTMDRSLVMRGTDCLGRYIYNVSGAQIIK